MKLSFPTQAEWESYVENEANLMFARMVALMRSKSSDPRITGLDEAVMMQTGQAFSEAASNIKTVGDTQSLTDNLVAQYRDEVDELLEKANITQIEIDENKTSSTKYITR